MNEGRNEFRGPWRFDAPCCHTMVVDKPMAGHKERRYLTAVPMECQCWEGKPISIS